MKKKWTLGLTLLAGIALAGGVLTAVSAVEPLDVKAAVGDTFACEGLTYESVYETGFESAKTSTNYQGNVKVSASEGDGASWEINGGTVTATDSKYGNNHIQMRFYKGTGINGPSGKGLYALMTSSVSNVSFIEFKYAADNSSFKADVQYSDNQGSTWQTVGTISNPTSAYNEIFQYAFESPVEDFRLKVLLTDCTATKTVKFSFDEVKLGALLGDYNVTGISYAKGEGAKDTYYEGDTFDPTGYTITANYDNDTTADVTQDVDWDLKPLTTEDTNVTASYTFKDVTVTVDIPVTVNAREITSLRVENMPNKVSYVTGDALNLDGLKVIANYNVGESADVTAGVTTDPADGEILTQAGSIAVKVTYEGHETSFNINVEEGPDYSFEFTKQDFDKPNQTKMLGDISWTLNAEFTGETHFGMDTSSGRGFQIGASKKQASKVSLRTTDLFLASTDGALVQKVVVNASGATGINANLEVKIGGTDIGNAKNLTKDATDYTFIASEPLMGRVEILITPIKDGSKLGAATYIKSITIYADESNEYAGMALLVAKEIETADVCKDELNVLQSVKQAYDDLGAEGQALINNVYLDDYADGNIQHEGGRIPNRITVAEKVAAIESAIATKSIEASSFGVFGNNNNTKFITLLSLASLIGVGGIGFFFLKKKKGAH